MLAGVETTATVLVWAFHHLSEDANLDDSLWQELSTASSARSLCPSTSHNGERTPIAMN
jgi:cytochrome P450